MMIRRRFPIVLSLIVLLGCLAVEPTVGQAQPPPALLNSVFCIQELARALLIPPIPVGCESIDCCPGCPAREAITWRIRLGGDAVESMVLEFEGLPASSRALMTLEGNGRWVDERRLEIRPGVTSVRGLPREVQGRSPVALARIGRMRGDLEAVGDAARPFEVSVEQYVGSIRVNEFRLRYWLINCFRPPSRQDVVRIDNNVSNDNGIVLLDARRTSGCANDEVWRGAGSISIGNALSNGTCRSEVAVFSNHNAMQLVPNVTTWTDAVGDLLPVPLTPPWQAPVKIFVLSSPFSTTAGTGYGDAANDDVARANDLYGTMNCGLALQATIVNATTNPNAPGLLTRKCSQAPSLRSGIGFDPGKINVYYISNVVREDNLGNAKGAACGLVLATTPGLPPPTADDWNTILVSAGTSDAESLAHEVGHAFSLMHTISNPAIPLTNLMNGQGTGRNSLTEGQCFRVNVNPGSALNANGVRTGPTRSCPDATTSSECPALSLDVNPNN
jgi:hypothetical protein